MNDDILRRFVFEGSAVRGEIVRFRDLWQTVQEQHDYADPVRAVLGECVAAGALLTATVKLDGKLTIQANGSGALSLLVVEATSRRTLRALARCDDSRLGAEPTLEQLLGDGRLAITLDPGGETRRYQGLVEARGACLSEALEDYFARSEQLPTRLWLAANRRACAGLLLQRLPGRGTEDDDEAARETWRRSVVLSDTIRPCELLEAEAEDILRRLYADLDEPVRLFRSQPWRFRCNCSRERVKATLEGLGRSELSSMLEEQGRARVECEFCAARYRFDAVDLAELIHGHRTPRAPAWTM